MQGDLKHIESKNIQYYMNFFIKMYDEEATESYPRLPHCMSSGDLFRYIRWKNVATFLVLILLIVIVSRMYLRKRLRVRRK